MTEPIRAGTVNLERLKAWRPRASQVVAEINSMNLDLIGFQETTEEAEADLAKRLRGDWLVVSDHVNCPAFVLGDKYERIQWNGKSAIGMTLPGSVRSRYGSAAHLRRKSDGFEFTFATIHPSNTGEFPGSGVAQIEKANRNRIAQAESCWNYLDQWGVTKFPILLVGDMNDRNMPPNGLPGVFTSHGMTDILQKLKQQPRIDRAFLLGFNAIAATVNNVSAAVSDHDFGIFVVTPTVPAKLHGADVSSWQGVDWTPLPGDTFTFVKASEGSSYTNPARWSQLSAARTAGHQVGHYHFMRPGNPLEQARFFVNSAQVLSGELMVCDWENTGDGHPSVTDAAEFIAEVKRLLPENKCGLYCNRSDWMTTTVKAGDFLWIAEYNVDKPGTIYPWTFWQHSRDPIDQNWSRFTDLAELKKWAGELRAAQQ